MRELLTIHINRAQQSKDQDEINRRFSNQSLKNIRSESNKNLKKLKKLTYSYLKKILLLEEFIVCEISDGENYISIDGYMVDEIFSDFNELNAIRNTLGMDHARLPMLLGLNEAKLGVGLYEINMMLENYSGQERKINSEIEKKVNLLVDDKSSLLIKLLYRDMENIINKNRDKTTWLIVSEAIDCMIKIERNDLFVESDFCRIINIFQENLSNEFYSIKISSNKRKLKNKILNEGIKALKIEKSIIENKKFELMNYDCSKKYALIIDQDPDIKEQVIDFFSDNGGFIFSDKMISLMINYDFMIFCVKLFRDEGMKKIKSLTERAASLGYVSMKIAIYEKYTAYEIGGKIAKIKYDFNGFETVETLMYVFSLLGYECFWDEGERILIVSWGHQHLVPL